MMPRSAIALALLAAASAPAAALAQPGPAQSGPMQEAARLDLAGSTARARAIYRSLIDTVSDPAARAGAERAMAISYAFDGDCANTVRYEELAVAYWTTREQAEPQNAFYQEGELADEAARICLDAGDLAGAARGLGDSDGKSASLIALRGCSRCKDHDPLLELRRITGLDKKGKQETKTVYASLVTQAEAREIWPG